MAAAGVAGYAAVNARVRVMYATLLNHEELTRLYEAPDFPALITALKSTIYGPYLEKVRDQDLTPRRAAFQLRGKLASDYASIIRSVPTATRPLLEQLYSHFEVDNLKAVLRGIVTGSSWDRVRFVLFPFGSMTVLPAQAMLETGSVAAAIDLLQGTTYYETLSFALKRYTVEQNLFPLEVALDLHYWRGLWKEVNRLPTQDRAAALRIIGALVDTTNLMWAIRYREYHHLSEEELINYTLPFGYHVQDRDIRSIAAGADIAMLVSRLYPNLRNVDTLLQQDPRQSLPELEYKLQGYVARACHAAFVGNPFHIGVPLAYLVLQEMMIQDLVVLIEAKSTRAPLEAYRPYLLMDDRL